MSAEPASPVTRCSVRAGAYHDSIVLMRLQAALATLPGVADAAVMMGTPANRELLAAAGSLPAEAEEAGAGDLLIVVRAGSEAAAGEALARVDSLLAERRAGSEVGFRPRSLASALKQLPEAQWVLVSVPGRYAAGVAREALEAGRNVFLFSDNVPVAEEVALKRQARAAGLLVMGPDCGTAIIGGAGLGFANRVRRGAIGLVGASGTGLQAIASRVHALGAGISQAIGTGGRDLCEEVGGIAAAQALDLLRRDPETRVVVLVAKPPAPEVAARLLALAQGLGKPVVVDFLGAPLPGRRSGDLWFAASLSEAADRAVALLQQEEEKAQVGEKQEKAVSFAEGQRWVRGLFSGGTLAAEARLGLSAWLGTVDAEASPTQPDFGRGHTVADLGADELTIGRLHPMIDYDLRLRRLRQEAVDPGVAVILLDVVLGEGAHADPAGELAPAITRAREEARAAGRTLEVVAVVVGTHEDPQDLERQVVALEGAGARVFLTVGEAVEQVVALLARAPEPEAFPVPLSAIREPLAAVNVGLESFHDSLIAQGIPVVQVDWRPPAGGDERLAGILAKMKR